MPQGRVVRADGRAEPAASVVRDALGLADMIASSRHLTVLDLTACELELQAPGLPGRTRSAFEVCNHHRRYHHHHHCRAYHQHHRWPKGALSAFAG